MRSQSAHRQSKPLHQRQEMNRLLATAVSEGVIPNAKRLHIELKRRPIEWVREYLNERYDLIEKNKIEDEKA